MGTFLVQEEGESGYQEPDPGMGNAPSSTRSRKSGSVQVVEFVIGDERFTVDLFDSREVITTPEVTPIPMPPPIHHKDYITSGSSTIIDLRVIVLVTTVSDKMPGILVDDVSSVTTYTKEDIDLVIPHQMIVIVALSTDTL